MEDKKVSVYGTTLKIISQMENLIATSAGKAILANIRNSVGKTPGESMEVWKILFENMPEEFLGRSENLTYEEKSILAAIQLFAIQQQGKEKSCNSTEVKNMGSSLAHLRSKDNTVASDRRFNTMVTSDSFEELMYHLRQMIKLLSSREKDAKVNYPKLAEDLYWFSRGYRDSVRIGWSRSYYSYRSENKEIEEK